MIGKLSQSTLRLAASSGINILSGSVRTYDKRIIVFCPPFPGNHKCRYALRSRIVWWLHTGDVIVGCKFNIHHKNNNRQDDRFCNLKKTGHIEHLLHHNPKGLLDVTKTCKECGKRFKINRWRLKDKSRGQFCSPVCYYKHPKRKK